MVPADPPAGAPGTACPDVARVGEGLSDVERPVPYPASCRAQAWAAASAVPTAQALGAL